MLMQEEICACGPGSYDRILFPGRDKQEIFMFIVILDMRVFVYNYALYSLLP
jgi:hypothetical protein